MKFKGTLVITDPCYIAKKGDWGSVIDYSDREMPAGFTTYLFEDNKVGDGRWLVSQFKNIKLNDPAEFIKALEQEDPDYIGELYATGELEQLGSYSVDSGCFGVFYLDEILKYNPNFQKDYSENCYTIIPNFDGDVDVLETDCEKYVYGTGNKTFFTF